MLLWAVLDRLSAVARRRPGWGKKGDDGELAGQQLCTDGQKVTMGWNGFDSITSLPRSWIRRRQVPPLCCTIVLP